MKVRMVNDAVSNLYCYLGKREAQADLLSDGTWAVYTWPIQPDTSTFVVGDYMREIVATRDEAREKAVQFCRG